jgi:uncharacterized damage-inducible protein DinB
MESHRYPVGRFTREEQVTPARRAGWIEEIAALPAALRDAVAELDDARLDTPYREGGWTVRQVVHHLADSHLNAYTRFRLALTEEQPTIRPYDEKGWAELPDARQGPVELSLALLESLHARWSMLLRGVTPEQWGRTLVHPEQGRVLTLDDLLQLYAWHGRHHLAHIAGARERAE